MITLTTVAELKNRITVLTQNRSFLCSDIECQMYDEAIEDCKVELNNLLGKRTTIGEVVHSEKQQTEDCKTAELPDRAL